MVDKNTRTTWETQKGTCADVDKVDTPDPADPKYFDPTNSNAHTNFSMTSAENSVNLFKSPSDLQIESLSTNVEATTLDGQAQANPNKSLSSAKKQKIENRDGKLCTLTSSSSEAFRRAASGTVCERLCTADARAALELKFV